MAETNRDFLLPDLGEGLEDAVLVEWHVADGDTVDLNQNLCTVETAKATVDIPSPFAGRIVERHGAPGETLDVGTVLVTIATGDGGADAAPAAPAAVAPAPAAPAPAAAASASTGAAVTEGEAPAILVGYGPGHGTTRRRRRGGAAEAPAPVEAAVSVPSGPVPVLAKPPVRKLARDLGVDLQVLAPGSGPGGVITRDDVRAAVDGAPAPAPAAAEPVPVAVAPAAPAVTPIVAGTPVASAPVAQAGSVIPVTGIRARIAERMTQSRSNIPDANCSVLADCSRLMDVRALLRDAAERGGAVDASTLTPFSLILRLVVAALQTRPILNSTFDAEGKQITVHGAIHLGVAAETARGLMVPVVRDAQGLSTAELAAEVRRLALAGRAGTLTPAELVGSTFTVSNFGAFGLDEGYPVINYPEAAILGVGAIKPRALVVDGEIVARPAATFTLSFDHRVCDGGDAGAFLGRLRDLVEDPARLLLDV